MVWSSNRVENLLTTLLNDHLGMNRLASISNEHHVTRGEHVAVNEALALIQKHNELEEQCSTYSFKGGASIAIGR